MTDTLFAPTAVPQPTDTRVSFVHDFMVERGGAERVLVELGHAFPAAEVHTALFDPRGTYEPLSGLKVHAMLGRRQRLFSNEHRRSLPLAVRAFRNASIDTDVLIANSSGLSHLAHTTGLRIVYCQTPARWLHRTDEYLRRLPPTTTRLFSLAIRKWLLDVDREAIRSADALLVNSRHMAKVVAAIYGVESEVVIPPSSLSVDGPTVPIPDVDPGFFLTPSRLLSYKRVDVLLRAAEALPHARFLVIGDGPMRRALTRMAPSNVHFAGSVPEATLRWAYESCHAVVLTCADDYGLVPREAAAFGKVAVVPLAGGYLEQSADGVGSIAYPYGSWEALHGTLRPLIGDLSPPLLSVCDLDADRRAFRAQITDIVERTLGRTR